MCILNMYSICRIHIPKILCSRLYYNIFVMYPLPISTEVIIRFDYFIFSSIMFTNPKRLTPLTTGSRV